MAEHESALLTSQSSLDDHVDTYLRHKRMFGRSGYKVVDVVRAAGGRWDPDKKKWFAPNKDALIAMLATGKWVPDCMTTAEQMLRVLTKRQDAERAADHAKRAAAHAAECAARKPQPPSAEQVEAHMIRQMRIPPPTQQELDDLKPWGITQAQLQVSIKDGRLGPRGSLSTAKRLFLGLSGGYMTADAIGDYDPAKKRRERAAAAANAAEQQKKLPTLPPFQKTAFSRPPPQFAMPRGNGGVAKQTINPAPKVSAYEEPEAHFQVVWLPEDYKNFYEPCDVCGEPSLVQFPCECVETAQAMIY